MTTQWIITSDHRQALLYELKQTEGGSWRAEERGAIRSSHEDEHQHHRPSVLSRGPRPNESDRLASWGHEVEEEHRRFARETAAWIGRQVEQTHAEHVHVFAAPRALGMLREELTRRTDHTHLAPRLTLREGELTPLRPSELATHPGVLEALGSRRVAPPIPAQNHA